MFSGSCIGVILLVISLDFLRRLAKEYDRYIVARHLRALAASPVHQNHCELAKDTLLDANTSGADGNVAALTTALSSFWPSIYQQVVRASLHMVQFAVAYMVMLLAMYYNGYIIICIIIGAWIGAFVFSWENVRLRYGNDIGKFGLS